MSYSVPTHIHQPIFRAYDIRGIVETQLTPDTVYAIGLALGTLVKQSNKNTVYVARDGRLTGLELLNALSTGFQATGCDVINLGAVPTAVLYYACCEGVSDCGVMITGSHNPPEYNGLKTVMNGQTIVEETIQQLYHNIVNQRYHIREQPGSFCDDVNMKDRYCQRILSDININKPLKVVIDCGNGIGGALAPKLFKQLLEPNHGELICLYETVDGTFPNHHPDPSIPDNLADLINTVIETNADVGLAFDGDADRLGVVTNTGHIIWPDRQLMLFAKDVLLRNPSSSIIYDVKCSSHLKTVIENSGGKPVMWKTGHSLIKNKLAQMQAPLAGEMSGHLFFKERWYGFDDGLYCGARLLEIMGNVDESIDTIFSQIPDSINTPELKLPMIDAKKADFMTTLAKTADFGDAELITIDGLRVEFSDGWGLIRPSNTTPYLVLRFEANTKAALKRIITCFSEQLLKIDSTLKLPKEMHV